MITTTASTEAVSVSVCVWRTLGLVDVDDALYRACQAPGVPDLLFPVELYKTTSHGTGGLYLGQTGTWRWVNGHWQAECSREHVKAALRSAAGSIYDAIHNMDQASYGSGQPAAD